ncbi:MAG: CocE/NonD family hydrolase [Sphingobacteriales bacterium]|nr:CocE/NonD family hydrolase [Sphingobacteriales bacterium]
MKKIIPLPVVMFLFIVTCFGQGLKYTITRTMVPMRDGVKLFTVIISPDNATEKLPILMQRTPYGADVPDDLNPLFIPSLSAMAKEGYIFVRQDIRGKYKSEGNMEIHTPLISLTNKNKLDESTDTWDTVDWLIKNVPNNNGKAGIHGVSYSGWLALVGAVNPHPALKASSEQACMGDLFLNDDFHHNGAFRLSYGFEYTYEVEYDKTTDSDFPFPQYDLFNWYLKTGPLKDVNEKYFHNKVPTWNNFIKHPNYDAFWQQNSPLSYVSSPQIPQLHVGGYYDQEDINGPQLMYEHMEKKDTFNRNYIVLGPWNHGQWQKEKADSLGMINFESKTAVWFQELQKQWFDYWLKGKGDARPDDSVGQGQFKEAYCFQTGSNQWKTYEQWPPKESTIRKLYAAADNKCSFNAPVNSTGFVSYISDPKKPVPYRTLPIEATYGPGSRWRPWQVEDQRFVYTRPDVVSFTGDVLENDLTVTGKITAHVFASTTGTDADWVVKVIDVYPDIDAKSLAMSGYQLPVAMEVFRGRFRKNFSKPEPLTPNKVEEFVIDLHQINHTFLKGHKLMIQIQSTWFPVIDRNPQKYVPNIFEAKESDYIKAEQRIYFSKQYPTYIELPVMEE